LKQFHYDVALKQKAITYAAECGNRAAGCKFTASEAMICHWRNDCASRFLCKATTVASQGQRKKLPPYVFLNCKMIHKNEMLLKNVTVHAQNNGWMTAELMEVRMRNI
jgi:hypothetical protein